MTDGYDMLFGEEFQFTDKQQIRTYISELCRSGEKQSLFNEQSKNDSIVIFDNNTVEYISSDSSRRMELAGRIDSLCKANNLYAAELSTLRRCTVDFQQPALSVFDKNMQNLFFEFLNQMYSCALIIPIAAVTHEDEETKLAHFHLMYINRSEYDLIEII